MKGGYRCNLNNSSVNPWPVGLISPLDTRIAILVDGGMRGIAIADGQFRLDKIVNEVAASMPTRQAFTVNSLHCYRS